MILIMRSPYGPREANLSTSALTGLEAGIGLIDDVNAAFATHETVVAMTTTQGFQRVTDFHSETFEA